MTPVDNEDAIAAIYRSYGFKYDRKYKQRGILVFTLQNGYFDNAEIVSTRGEIDVDDVFGEYTRAGYACTKRIVRSVEDIEEALFKGFFFVDVTRERLQSDYERFTRSITSFYSSTATYKYIDAPYLINEKPGEGRIIAEITKRLDDEKASLFLIEAAAGYGKTCTAYELVHEILENNNKLPLFSELSRNRSAKIFRYVLLDEIDRTFPQLRSKLVESEVEKGRVVVVLDGFDELLRKSEDTGDFENTEPMLETIGELLKGNAKVVLTTRRTVIFEGDEFHKWVDIHSGDFDIYRLRLNEPRLKDWLASDRREAIERQGFDLESLANPVLLSYLRCIDANEFEEAIKDKDNIVSRYFRYMLEREEARQDLRLNYNGQYDVLIDIAKDMIDLGYTSESRDYIVEMIKERQTKILDEVRARYPSSEKPSRDEIANKLASHALLDKSAKDETKIGFINEFVFGNFLAENILKSEEWMEDDLRFVEPAVISFVPRSQDQKKALRESLSEVFQFLECGDRIDFVSKLSGELDFSLIEGEADSIEVAGISFGHREISKFQFNDCVFCDCEFFLSKFSDVTFLNCRFFDCDANGQPAGQIHVLGCEATPEFISKLRASNEPGEMEVVQGDGLREEEVEKYILENFWPVGSANYQRRRPIKLICTRSNEFSTTELYEGISRLKDKHLISDSLKHGYVEISNDHAGKIREILGREV